ncbi:hypothetical protein PspLS_10985 [Pyricularia sp. CBS 133598]|nr:hypothetical protein PspLS_10985 [Pyricularia sp. CBS 133598]
MSVAVVCRAESKPGYPEKKHQRNGSRKAADMVVSKRGKQRAIAKYERITHDAVPGIPNLEFMHARVHLNRMGSYVD